MAKVVLIILDGWGLRDEPFGNAVLQANTPNFDRLWRRFPHAVLAAAGESVGLPPGQMGTSEVNHMTIGAGRVIFQDLVRINHAIKDESFFSNQAIEAAFKHVRKHGSALHLKGLVSPGGVHSHQDHFYALLKAAKLHGIEKVYLHVFTDGRDTLPKSALGYIQELQGFLDELGVGRIASVSGRYYAMDRDHNWERTDKTFTLLTQGKGERYPDARRAIDDAYRRGLTDEYIEPARIEVGPGEEGTIASNDAVIFVNFRSDRPRQLVERFLENGPENLEYVTMTRYHPRYQVRVAFPPVEIKRPLGEVVGEAGLRQLRVTETEKFAHLTFFFNCKEEDAFEGEDRMMLDSHSDIKTHDERPEMRAADIARETVQAIEAASHDFITVNLCNADMVGHSGDLRAATKAVEAVDRAVGEIVRAARRYGNHVIITADHGNAEEMIDEKTGEVLTAHTTNPVPLILISDKYPKIRQDQAGLVDIAPTILKIFGIDKPEEMTGISLC